MLNKVHNGVDNVWMWELFGFKQICVMDRVCFSVLKNWLPLIVKICNIAIITFKFTCFAHFHFKHISKKEPGQRRKVATWQD